MEQEVKEEKVEKTVSNSEIDETNDNGIPRTLSFDKEDTFNEVRFKQDLNTDCIWLIDFVSKLDKSKL